MSQPFALDDQELAVPGPSSRDLWNDAKLYEPMGVQGEGKFYPPYPFYLRDARGAYVTDEDGRHLLDYWAAAGPAVLGHADPLVLESASETMNTAGVLYTGPHRREALLARTLADLVPSAEMSAFVCGGSDAIAFGVRLARSVTQRRRIIKFEGAYHGWYDAVLFSVRPNLHEAGPDDQPVPVAESSGLPASAYEDIVILPYNDEDALRNCLSENAGEVALLIVEPILHSCGFIMPEPGFLETVRELCTKYGVILMFDEIITGFRHDLGGAQKLLDVTPDLTALGKAMSNGFPISALVGGRDYMQELAPSGPVFLSGTFNGNVLCVSAALATVDRLRSGEVHKRTFAMGDYIREQINEAAKRHEVTATCLGYGSVWSVLFSDEKVASYRELARVMDQQFVKQEAYRQSLLADDIFIYPRWINRNYISAAHSDEDIEKTIRATDAFFQQFSAHL